MQLKTLFSHNLAPHLCIGFDGETIRAINLNTAERVNLPSGKYEQLFLKDIPAEKPLDKVNIIVKGGVVQCVQGSCPMDATIYDYDNRDRSLEEQDWEKIQKETPCEI